MNEGLYLGALLKKVRKRAGLTQQTIADTYQYDRTLISLYELNKAKTPGELFLRMVIDFNDREAFIEWCKHKSNQFFDAMWEAFARKNKQMIQLSDFEQRNILI